MSLDVYLQAKVDTGGPELFAVQLFTANITHNLNTMAEEAGIYKHLWHPDELDITEAGELIESLEAGLKQLREDPERFKKHNPSNGWGTYEGLVRFVARYLEACIAHPKALVDTWG